MDYKTASVQELMERRSAIMQDLETADDARLNELETEARAIKEELETRKAAEQKRAAIRDAVAQGEGEKTKEFRAMPETKTRTVEEIRASREYEDAYVRYFKTNDPRECRALLTTNATDPAQGNSNTVPVPTYIDGRIRTAWEKDDLLSLINRTYLRGNVGVGFEVSATDAVIHAEGADAPAEEQLVLGTVTLIPQTIKKWIRISDEVLDMGGREFLDYIYDEITAKILKKLRETVINKVVTAPIAQTGVTTAVAVPGIVGAPSLDIVAKAIGYLSDEASDITIVMNRQTHAQFITAMAGNGFMFDPFMGHRVRYSSALPAYSAGTTAVWMIVGDLRAVQANFPNGDDVKLKLDDLTEAEADLVKIVGRLPVAVDVTRPGMLAKVVGAIAAGGGAG